MAMQIDGNGTITATTITLDADKVYKPDAVSFRATNGSTVIGTDTDIVFTQTDWNVGSHYNTANGRFTAPYPGTYMFYLTALYTYNGSTATWKVNLNVNGARDAVFGEWQTSGINNAFNTAFNSCITCKLNAGDYVNMFNDVNDVHISSVQTKFGGYFLG